MDDKEELILDERQAYCRGKLGGTNPYVVGTKFHTLWTWGNSYAEYYRTRSL